MSEVTIGFLDVGQGDATVIILPDKMSAIIVDCFKIKPVEAYLAEKKISSLPYIFLTHTDIDHARDIPKLLQNFMQKGTIFFYNPDTMYPKDKPSKRLFLQKLNQLIELKGLKIRNPKNDDSWDIQGVKIEVLHPDPENIIQSMADDDTNNISVLLRLTFATQRVLFAADIQGNGWKWIVERNTDLKADMLKFPHHGAWYQSHGGQPSLNEILTQVNPSLIIISVGTTNPYNHPHKDTFELLRASNARFMCTQTTKQCFSSSKKIQPCAGTIEVTLAPNQSTQVTPNLETHSKIIQQFDQPQCRKGDN